MNWNSDTGKALKTSLIIHGVIFAAVVVGGVVTSYFNKPVVPPHVFQLQGLKGPQHIGAPGRMAGDRKAPRTDKPTTSAQTAGLNLPKLDQRNVEPVDDGADAAPEKPAQAKPQPEKATAKSTKNTAASSTKKKSPNGKKAATSAKATATKPAKQQTMSYNDFAKQHKISQKKSGNGSASGKKQTGKKNKGGASINTAGIIRDMKSNLSWGDGGDGGGGIKGGTGMTSGDSDALADYFQRVRALIDSNFDEPKGVMQQVSALVQFTILADGTVTGVSVVRSSGNDTFDNAAVAAVRGLGKLDPPPGNMAYTRKIEFQGRRDQ